jgi:hypothetical protein
MKTIYIHAKEYFDKANANSYFASKVYVDDELKFELSFRYGYGEQFRYESMQQLVKAGMLERGTWQECKEKGIKVLDNLETDCKKSEVKAFVKK